MFQHPVTTPLAPTAKREEGRFNLPGWGLPIDWAPQEIDLYGIERTSLFPTAINDRDIAKGDAE